MSRYTKLFETVRVIVRDYGVGVLTEARFWGLLTDLYPFASESSLREIFRICIAKGWIADLVSLSGDKVGTLEYIRQTVYANPHLVRGNLVACLFSVSIALGICSEEDHEMFFKTLMAKPRPTVSNAATIAQKPSALQQAGFYRGGNGSSNGRNTGNYQSTHQNTATQQSGNNHSGKSNKSKKPQNTFLLFGLGLTVLLAMIIIPMAIKSHNEYQKSHGVSAENIEYEKKVKENEELVKKRENFDSVLSIKDIKLGSKYVDAVKKVKSSSDFHGGKELSYEMNLSKGYHPVFLLMNDRISIDNNVSKGSSGDFIRGALYTTQTNLDTILIVLKIFEWDGKIPFVMVEGREVIISYERDYAGILKLYFEKYSLAERRTYDGMPYNKEKYYPPVDTYEERHEDCVWTFSKGVIRLGLNRIVYIDSEFLDEVGKKFEVADKKRLQRKKAEEDSIRKEEKRKRMEDSLRRVRRHEEAIRDI